MVDDGEAATIRSFGTGASCHVVITHGFRQLISTTANVILDRSLKLLSKNRHNCHVNKQLLLSFGIRDQMQMGVLVRRLRMWKNAMTLLLGYERVCYIC